MKTTLTPSSSSRRPAGWRNILRSGMLLGAGLFLCGCVATTVHRAYKPDNSIISSNAVHRVAVIEFDDQGVFWERRQLEKAMSAIADVSPSNNVVLIAYVHGWKHNASDESKNLESFGEFVRNFSTVLNPKGESRHTNIIVGVYLAWRGHILPEPLQTLGYWNRRNTARRVSGVSATEAILSLIGEARTKPSHRVVVVGHSMGGLIVERAVTQAMVGSRLMNSDLVDRLVALYGSTNSESFQAAAGKARFASNELVKARSQHEAAQAYLPQLTNNLNDAQNAEKRAMALHAGELKQWGRDVEACRLAWWAVVTNHVSGTNFAALLPPEDIQASGDRAATHARLRRLSEEISNRRWRPFVEDETRVTKESYGPVIRNLLSALAAEDKTYLTLTGMDQSLTQIRTDIAKVQKSLAETSTTVNEAAGQIPKLRSDLTLAQTNYAQLLEASARIAGVVDRPPADLVLLINPASEALVAQKTIEAFSRNPIFKRSQNPINRPDQPWIISVSSKEDFATRTIFPIAETLSAWGLTCGEPVLMTNRFQFEHRSPFAPTGSDALTHYYRGRRLGEGDRTISQRTLVTQTAPHTDILRTHEVKKGRPHPAITNFTDIIQRNLHNPTWNEVVGTTHNFYVKPETNGTISSYWILKADKELLPNHNEFFTRNFYALAVSLYRMSVDERGKSKVVPADQIIADATP